MPKLTTIFAVGVIILVATGVVIWNLPNKCDACEQRKRIITASVKQALHIRSQTATNQGMRV